MNFKKHNSQSGRSMVEMLGVLAIIGVLSVGGIAGYSLSMRRHRANQIVDYASKYALSLYSICQQKILNGDMENFVGCSSHEFSGVERDFPAGVTDMFPGNCITDETTGVDTIDIGIKLSEKKLCQAVGSITGASVVGCASNIVVIKIKQN